MVLADPSARQNHYFLVVILDASLVKMAYLGGLEISSPNRFMLSPTPDALWSHFHTAPVRAFSIAGISGP